MKGFQSRTISVCIHSAVLRRILGVCWNPPRMGRSSIFVSREFSRLRKERQGVGAGAH